MNETVRWSLSVLWLAVKVALLLLLMNQSTSFFLYQNF